MEFGILGSLEVRSAGTEIVIGAPKLRALLTALLLDVGRVVPADRLIEDLWGDDATPQAMTSLRSYVSNLRRLLPPVDGSSPIATRGAGYALEVDPVWVDAVRFERDVRRGRRLLDDGDHPAAVEVLDASLGLWRGPALFDVADLPFARASAVRLEELRLAATEDRLDALLWLGRHVEVVAEAEALVADHRLRERPRGLLMLALYRSGRVPEALAAHRAYRDELADELGLDPSARIDALAEAILRQDPELDLLRDPVEEAVAEATSDPTVAHATAPAEPAPSELPLRTLVLRPVPATEVPWGAGPPLVGRAAERGRLATSLDGLAEGRGEVVLLAGEAGIGKTALLRQLSAEADTASVPVAWGRCHEARGAPPFWPWVQVLRTLAERMDDATLLRATSGAAGPVTHLVPEIAERVGRREEPAPAEPQAARFALHEAVTTFLIRVAAHRGLVVVVDDLHWGDLASLELAAFLGEQAGRGSVLLAGSYRDTGSERSPELDACLAALARAEVVRTLRLAGLTAADVGRLAADVAGEGLDARLAQEIHRRAGGNPFFVRQLAQLRAESDGEIRPDAVPVAVRHVLLQRLALLPAAVRTTLEVASVLGQEFDVRPLARCRDLPVPDVMDELDVAAGHGLVEDTSGATGWRFLHALIRDTLHDELRPSRVARLHVAAADALEAHHPPPVQAIAEHLWLAADLVEPGRPVAWLRAAAEEALAVFAYEQGEQYLRQVLHLLAHRPDASTEVELDVRVRLVQVLVGLHGWAAEEIAEVAERARELSGEGRLGPELTSLFWSRWALLMTRGELDEARRLSHQLLDDVAERGTPAERMAGHIAVTYTEVFRGASADELRPHLDAATTAEAAADGADLALTPEHLAVSLRITRALVAAFAGDADAALDAIGDGIVTAQRLAIPFSEGYARMFGGLVAALLDRPEEGRRLAEPALEACERLGLEHLANLAIPSHAWACARLGEDPATHADRIATAVAGLGAVGHRHAVPLFRSLLAEARAAAGEREAAVAALEDARALGRELGEQVYGVQHARAAVRLEAALVRGPEPRR